MIHTSNKSIIQILDEFVIQFSYESVVQRSDKSVVHIRQDYGPYIRCVVVHRVNIFYNELAMNKLDFSIFKILYFFIKII